MIAWLLRLIPPGRGLAVALFAVALIVLVIVALAVRSCAGSGQRAAQATQDVRAADAYAGAAENAVAAVVAAGDREKSVDEIVTQASEDIDHAKDPAAARAATIAAVCRMRAYSNRPECKVQPINP